MVVVYTPLSIWVQCASLAFTLGGMHGDLLAIRFFLFLAYVFLFLNACLGSPLWGAPTNSGGVAVDSLLWAVLNMYVHGSSLVRLVLDERPVHLTEDEDALWRMFYRTGGLSKRLFHAILVPHLEVIEAQAGDELLTEDFFYIQYHGRAHLQVLDGERLVADRYTRSGEMFDFKCLGMFPANTMIAKHVVKCRCENRTKLFRFSRANMERIAHHNFVKGIWQSLLINNISFVLERQRVDDRDCILPEGACDAIFAPLQPWEEPNSILAGSNKSLSRPTAHLLFSIHKSFSPPWPFGGHPTGMRQVQLPPPVPPPSGDPQAYPPLHNISSRGWHDEDEDDIGTTGHRMRTWLWSIPRRVMSRRNSAESSSSTPALGELEPDTVEDDFEGKVATEQLVEATEDWQVAIHDRPEAAARASRENENTANV